MASAAGVSDMERRPIASDQKALFHGVGIRALIRRVFVLHHFENTDQWRQHLAEKLHILGLGFVPLSVLASLPVSHDMGHYVAIAIQLGIIVWLLLALTVRRGIMAPSGISATVLFFVFNAVLIAQFGPGGVQPVLLVMVTALSGGLFGLRGVIWTTVANALMLGLCYTFIPHSYGP